jgi:hypothetical protein
MRRQTALVAFAASLATLVTWGLAPGRAFAHDPIIFGSEQKTPALGPLLPDGTVSFAIYGTLDEAGDSRGLRTQLADGDELLVQLLIPNLAPENELSDDQLPIVELTDPTGAQRTLGVGVREPFDEPFTGTRYVEYIELREPAIAGTYEVTVTGTTPARFTLAIGQRETFGTPVENALNRESGLAGVQEWYAQPVVTTDPPTTEPPTTEPPTTDGATTEPLTTEPLTTEPLTTDTSPPAAAAAPTTSVSVIEDADEDGGAVGSSNEGRDRGVIAVVVGLGLVAFGFGLLLVRLRRAAAAAKRATE